MVKASVLIELSRSLVSTFSITDRLYREMQRKPEVGVCCFCGVSYLVQWWRGVGTVVLGKEQVDEDCMLRGT